MKQFNINQYLKFTFLCILFLWSLLYAGKCVYEIIITNEYQQTLVSKGIKLQTQKVYILTTEAKLAVEQDTVYIPLDKKSYPKQLGTLYYDSGWRLKLEKDLLDSDKDTLSNPFLPWCCTQQATPEFFKGKSIISPAILMRPGIKFNRHLGGAPNRITVQIHRAPDNNFYLDLNVHFLNLAYSVNTVKGERFELSFGNHLDTNSLHKNVFLFPFLNPQHQPATYFVDINKQKLSVANTDGTPYRFNIRQNIFEINHILFELKDNFSMLTLALIGLIFIILFIGSVTLLYRYWQFMHTWPHENLIVIENLDLLAMRLTFNCIIWMGFPILLLKAKISPDRLYLYTLLVVLFNLNLSQWFQYLQDKLSKIEHSKELKNTLVVIGSVLLLVMHSLSYNEKLWNIPILYISKFFYIFLPIIIIPNSEKELKAASPTTDTKIVWTTVGLSFLISVLSHDFATCFFTVIALFFIRVLQEEKVPLDWKQSIAIVVVCLVMGIVVQKSNIFATASKSYRVFSTIYTPDDPIFETAEEQHKQTIAQQIYLVKTSLETQSFMPNTNQAILPAWKSTFFSDYGVLWSFKIGGFLFLIGYFLLLVQLTYNILSLLIILNKKIPLRSVKMISYSKTMIYSFNIFLSLTLIQYLYTFFSNFWYLPVTGQSPGVLCPSYLELFFHLLFINGLTYYLKQVKLEPLPEIYPIVYTKIKRNTRNVIIGLCVLLFAGFFWQLYRIHNLTTEMTWFVKPVTDITTTRSRDSLLILGREALQRSAKEEFKELHNNYYRQSKENRITKFRISTDMIVYNTNVDSIHFLVKRPIATQTPNVYVVEKLVNNQVHQVITDALYSGYPPNSTTVQPDLQKSLNATLATWANRVNADSIHQHKMLTGCILIANHQGEVISSSSYPLLYNMTSYYVDFLNTGIKKFARAANNPDYNYNLKKDHIEDYLNASEFDQMPGSVVKPLLGYCGYKMSPQNLIFCGMNMSQFLSQSNGCYANELFLRLAGQNLDSLKSIYKTDFGIPQFHDLKKNDWRAKGTGTLKSYAIGQQNELIFKDIVQAYTRIKVGKKIEYRFIQEDDSPPEALSLNRLEPLHQAMSYMLRNGTGQNVGRALERQNIPYAHFLGKTGTAQMGMSADHNKTSSIIIVTNTHTVGIQLFGDLPSNDNQLAAKHLFIEIISVLNRYGVFK